MVGPSRLAWNVGHNPKHLEKLSAKVNRYYDQRDIPKDKDVRYLEDFGVERIDQITRPSGFRTITVSRGPLKEIQRRIHAEFFAGFPWPEYVQGGVKGRSNVTNARRHLGKKHRFLTDIEDFFPSVDHHKVYEALRDHLDFSPDAARLATRLTTYKRQLPQGTSTSPFLANLAFLPVDRALARFCARHGITYSRFVDDLTFSSPREFASLTGEIRDVIARFGFRLQQAKTCYRSRPVEVTGVVVENNRLRAPTRLKDKLKTLVPASPAHQGLKAYIDHIEEPYR